MSYSSRVPESNPPDPANAHESLPAGSGPRSFDVVVPLYVRVRVTAEDEFAAEADALAAIRRLSEQSIDCGGSATATFRAIIAPIVGEAKS